MNVAITGSCPTPTIGDVNINDETVVVVGPREQQSVDAAGGASGSIGLNIHHAARPTPPNGPRATAEASPTDSRNNNDDAASDSDGIPDYYYHRSYAAQRRRRRRLPLPLQSTTTTTTRTTLLQPTPKIVKILQLLYLSLLILSSSSSFFLCEASAQQQPHPQQPQPQHRRQSQSQKFPSVINLRAGVIHAPPFATITEQRMAGVEDGSSSLEFGGFQIDLLKRLTKFAKADNVTLNVKLTRAPEQEYDKALDLVANDCIETTTATNKVWCNQLDLIVGNYYATPDRALRVDLSPAWLRSAISAVKYIGENKRKTDSMGMEKKDYTTLTQANNDGATVCLKGGTFYSTVVMNKFPKIAKLFCSTNDKCLEYLKEERCVLYPDDELQLLYRAAWDSDLEVTPEHFNTQYIVWPRSYNLDPMVNILLNRWILAAVTNTTLDELYSQYFQKALCPIGTAGESCELPCDPDHGRADNRGVCRCESTKWVGDDCSIEVLEELNLLPQSMVVICYTLVTISFLVVILFVAWFVYNRDRAQVRITQPSFLMLILLGCVISTSTIIALAQEDPGDGPVYSCMAIPWLYSVGFCITFGAMFARIRRIYGALQYAAELTQVIVSAKETYLTVGLVLGIDVAILTIWTTTDPLRWDRVTTSTDLFGVPLESEGYCTSERWGIFAGIIGTYHLLLMGTACYMTYIARKIPDGIANLKYVGIAMFSNLQIFVVVMPVLIVVGSDPQSSFLVMSLAIWINDFVVVGLIFGNFVYQVYIFDQGNKVLSSRNMSLVNSRTAIRASIVAFARSSGSSHFNTESLNSQHSKRQSNRPSVVRFSDNLDEPDSSRPTWDVQTENELDMLEQMEETTLERRQTDATTMLVGDSSGCDPSQTETIRVEDLGYVDTGQDMLSVSDSAISFPQRDLRKGISDGHIVPRPPFSDSSGLELGGGMSDAQLASPEVSDPLGRDISERKRNSSAGGSIALVLEKPALRSHRSMSEPSLTALKQVKKRKSGPKLGPESVGFIEFLHATYGQMAASATRTDMPAEQFKELLEQTYGATEVTPHNEGNPGTTISSGDSPPKAGTEGEEEVNDREATGTTWAESDDQQQHKEAGAIMQLESEDQQPGDATTLTSHSESSKEQAAATRSQASDGAAIAGTPQLDSQRDKAEAQQSPNMEVAGEGGTARAEIVPGEQAESLALLDLTPSELLSQGQPPAGEQQQLELVRPGQSLTRQHRLRQSAVDILCQSQTRSSFARRGPTFWGPKENDKEALKSDTVGSVPGAVFHPNVSLSLPESDAGNEVQVSKEVLSQLLD